MPDSIWPSGKINDALAGRPPHLNQYGGQTINGVPYGSPDMDYPVGPGMLGGNVLAALSNQLLGTQHVTPGSVFGGAYPPADSGAWVYKP